MKNIGLLLFIISHLVSTAQTMEETMDLFWMQHELEFQYQAKDYQFRSNDTETLKFGDILYKLFDIRKEEVSVLTVNDGEVKVLEDENEIWNFDLLAQYKRTDDGKYNYEKTVGCSKLTSNVVLNLSYRTHDKKSDDKSISKVDAMLNVHLQYPSGVKGKAIYVQATFCQPPILLERIKQGILTQPKCKSILLAYDYRTKKENIDEFYKVYNSALDKLKNKKYDDLSYVERDLVNLQYRPDIASDFYWGKKVFLEGRYWDAILYFENVYNALQKTWWDGSINDDEIVSMTESSFYIGYCYYELGLYNKALKYLEFAKDLGDYNYCKKEYINCLVALHDIRAIYVINSYMDIFIKKQEADKLEPGDDEYFMFLNRRKAYCLTDLKKYKEAKDILESMLKTNPNDDYVKRELEYIKSLENK